MKRWMTVVIVAIATTFAVTVSNPIPAKAIDTGQILIYTSAGVGAAVVLVLVATYMTRDEGQIFLTDPPPDPTEQDDSRIHFGMECRNPDGTISLLCW